VAIQPRETLMEYAERVRREVREAHEKAFAARSRIAAERQATARRVDAAARAQTTR
jgi:hypothetical protein